MKKLLLTLTLSLGLTLGACSTLGIGNKPNCYESVAISKISLTQAYKQAATLSNADAITVKTAEKVLTSLDQADSITDNASAYCAIDEATAYDLLGTASNILDDAAKLMQGDPVNG